MILLLDNYDSFTFNLYQVIAKFVKNVEVVRNDKITLDQIHQLDPQGIIISPGPGKPEEAGISIDLIKAFAGKKPILGVCLGHQAITVAFGGKVVLASEPVHGKEVYIFHHRQNLYKDMPLPFVAGRYHSLIAEKAGLPADLIVEAESDQGLVMGVRHKDHPIYGVQFHPESILTPEGERLLQNFIKICQQNNEYTPSQ